MNLTANNEIKRAFDEYVRECRYSKQLRPATLKNYQDAFNIFTRLLPELSAISDIQAHCMSIFFERLAYRYQAQGKEIKGSTIHAYYTKLIMFFRWLETKGHIEQGSVCSKIVKPPAPHYNDEKALTSDEVAKIVTAIVLHTKHHPFLYKRDLMIVNLLLYTGVRRNELLNIKVKDVDFTSQSLLVDGTTSKSKKTRRIPLHQNVLYHISNFLEERKDRTCPYLIITQHQDKQLSSHGLTYFVTRYKKLANLHFHLHQFRHTFACNLAKHNADIITIKNMLGHSSITMTERYLRSLNSENARQYIKHLYS